MIHPDDRDHPSVAFLCDQLRSRLAGDVAGGLAGGLRCGVVGCGDGSEVVTAQRHLAPRLTVGLDLAAPLLTAAAASGVALLRADALRLPFRDGSLDAVIANHSLEHFADPRVALAEIHRVLAPGGWLALGVPNKSRAVGYVGSPGVSLRRKLLWNLYDYRDRLRGRFENRYGAHAGFTRRELSDLLGERFADVAVVSREYMAAKYRRGPVGALVQVGRLLGPRLEDALFPAHYAVCSKRSWTGPARRPQEGAPDRWQPDFG